MNITGTLIWYYFICHREVWLMAHGLEPFHDHPFLEIGRLIAKESYKKQKKEIRLENMVIDLIDRDQEKVVVGEIKKSSRFIHSARMQLAFYLKELKKKKINVTGELLFPKERRREKVELTEEIEHKLEQACQDIEKIVALQRPPTPLKNRYCKKCAYLDFCWS